MIKKVIAWPLAHGLYYIGDLLSRFTDVVYTGYSRTMCASIWFNDWGNLSIWTATKYNEHPDIDPPEDYSV